MTDKEFKRLKRSQLIEIIYELQLEQQKLTEEKEELQRKLDAQQIRIENAGSIAEATAALSDIFAVAQQTADKYLAEVQNANMLREQQSKELLASAQTEAEEMISKAEKQSDELKKKTQNDVEEQWSQFQKNVTDVLNSHDELKSFLNNG